MKIENNYYVLMKVGNIEARVETSYLGSDNELVGDIESALKFVNRRTAFIVRRDYEEGVNSCYDSGLEIVPVKQTYEW